LNIGNKLRSLCRHTESEGIILRLWDEVHAYPPELNQRINSLQDPEVSDRVADWNRKQGAAVRKIQMSSGELLLIRPLNPPDDRTLAYLARQLEEDLEFCKIFDNICRANLAISSHLALKPLLHKVMSLTEEILD